MKKFLMIMLLSFVGLFASAESVWFKAYNYAIKYKTEYNRNNSSGWSDVEICDVPIEFKMNDDMIIIYSNKTQIYGIYEDAGTYNDNGGGQQQAYYVIDPF